MALINKREVPIFLRDFPEKQLILHYYIILFSFCEMFCYMQLLTFIIITARVYSLKGTWPSATTVLIFCIVVAYSVLSHYLNPCWNLYYNYERYPLSPLWRSLNNIYPIFLTPCIRCTNYLCGFCDLTDVHPHFIPSLLRMIQNVDLLWRHLYKSRSPAIVTSQWPIVPVWLLWTLS